MLLLLNDFLDSVEINFNCENRKRLWCIYPVLNTSKQSYVKMVMVMTLNKLTFALLTVYSSLVYLHRERE